MVVHDEKCDAFTSLSTINNTGLGHSNTLATTTSTLSYRHIDGDDGVNDADLHEVIRKKHGENHGLKSNGIDDDYVLPVTDEVSFHGESTMDNNSCDDSNVDDVILYPAGGGFNKIRKKQQYLESLLMQHWFAYTQVGVSLKKDYVIKNILTPIHNSGRQFKIYNPHHLQNGEPKYVVPNTDVAFERIAQKLRDMKKSQTAKAYQSRTNATPVKKRKKQELVKAKAANSPRSTKKSVATKCKRTKKTVVAPTSKKPSTTLSMRTQPPRQARPAMTKKLIKTNKRKSTMDQDNDPILHKRNIRSKTKQKTEEKETELLNTDDVNVKETFVSIYVPPMPLQQSTNFISSNSSLISNGRNCSTSAFTKHTDMSSVHMNTNSDSLLYKNKDTDDESGTPPMMGVDKMMKKYSILNTPVRKSNTKRKGTLTSDKHSDDDDEDYVDFSDSDDDDDIISEDDSFVNETTISSSSTVNHQNGRRHRQSDRKDKTKRSVATGGGGGGGGSCNDSLSMNELKEIVWSQWEQIDCWRRLCCQYKETYHIQREVILQQDKLLSTVSPSTLGISKSTSRTGCMSNMRRLSIPRLSHEDTDRNSYSPSTMYDDAPVHVNRDDHDHNDEIVAITSNPEITNMIVGEDEETNVTICEV